MSYTRIRTNKLELYLGIPRYMIWQIKIYLHLHDERFVTVCDKTLEIANSKKNVKPSIKKEEFNKTGETTKDCESFVRMTQFQEIQLTKVLSTKDTNSDCWK